MMKKVKEKENKVSEKDLARFNKIKKETQYVNKDGKKASDAVLLKFSQKPNKLIVDLLIVVIVIALIVISIKDSKLTLRDPEYVKLQLHYLWQGFTHPNWNMITDMTQGGIPYLTLQTIAIAFAGTFFAAVVAIPFGFITAKNVVGNKISKIGELILIVIRTFPELVLALVLIRVVGMGATTGALTIGIHSIGMLAKLYAESIENMDPGPIEALDAVGANVWQKIKYGIIPQVLPDFISTALYRFDINVRSATILGMVSAGGLGAPLIFASQAHNWFSMSAILIAIVIMVVAVDFISSALRKRLI